jgi:electron transfer flavoprotein alpha subunit
MADIYAYITHKGGVADDSALELVAAAKKIDAGAAVTAIVTGSGADVDDKVAAEVAGFLPQVIKFNHDALAYPNAEVVRKLAGQRAAGRCHRADSPRHLRHGPGARPVHQAGFGLRGRRGGHRRRGRWHLLKVIRQEYSGMVSTHVT